MAESKTARRIRQHLVLGYLEGISSAVFQRYSEEITALVGKRQGVYALYKGERLYYVGLATNLRRRVKQHLRDRHAGKWSRFSVYLIRKADYIKELESLILRIADPAGNSVRGRLVHADNLLPTLQNKMREASAREIEKLLGVGGRKRTVRRPAASKAKKKSRSRTSRKAPASFENPSLAPYVTKRFMLRADYKGRRYEAWVHSNGTIQHEGKKYYSPSGAARAVVGRASNGWRFWKYRNAPGEWVELRELRTGKDT